MPSESLQASDIGRPANKLLERPHKMIMMFRGMPENYRSFFKNPEDKPE
jgi:hypothetical protein